MVLNRNRVRSYTFSEFRVEYDKKDNETVWFATIAPRIEFAW